MKELRSHHIITFILLTLLCLAVIAVGLFWFYFDAQVSRIWFFCGEKLERYSRTEAAQYCYRHAIGRDTENGAVYLASADLYLEDENFTQAEKVLNQAISNIPNRWDYYYTLCKTYTSQGKLLDAVTLLDNIADEDTRCKLEALRPDTPVSNYESGEYNGYFTVTVTGSTGICSCLNGDYPTSASRSDSVMYQPQAGENTLMALCLSDDGIPSRCVTYRYDLVDVIEIFNFTDPTVESLVRSALKMDEGSYITSSTMVNVTSLEIDGSEAAVTTLEDLRHMVCLRSLTVRNLPGMDWSFLSCLTELTELTIHNCSIAAADLQSLQKLDKLTNVDLSNNQIASVEALRDHGSIRILDLSNNSLQNIEPLATIRGLTNLSLCYNAVTSLEPLKELSRLAVLDCSYLLISDLRPLENNTSLVELHADYCSITDLSPLAGCVNLQLLSCSSNQLVYIEALENCTRLREIRAARNKLTDLTPLAGLTELSYLDVSTNLLTALPGDMSAMKALRYFIASDNGIRDLSPLADHSVLEEVNAEYNKVSSLEPLTSCSALIVVRAFGNSNALDISTLEEQGVIVYR